MPDKLRGVVLSDQGNQVVVDVDGEELACVIRKTLRRGRRGKPVVVGDRVTVQRSGEGAVVVAVEERRSLISRQDPSHQHREQVLVANLDAVLIVASAKSPDLVPGLIDRFLIDAESRDLEIAIAINKIDLDPENERADIVAVYAALEYPVLEVSSTEDVNIQPVRDFLAGRTTALFGHSGVGKSSLANALDPSLSLRTGEVHGSSGLGTHTTSATSLLRLPWGGYLVDTPGIREFGLWRMDRADLRFGFREIARIQQGCRFNDCLHENEPHCAVKAAVDGGEIVRWRYESYLRVLVSLQEK